MTIKKSILLTLLYFTLSIVPSIVNVYADSTYGNIQILIKQGQYEEALNLIEEQLSINSLDMKLQFMNGFILTKLERHSEAEVVFLQLTEENPELPETFNSLAVVYVAQGKYAEAEKAFKKAIEIYPKYVTAHENLGDVYVKMASQAYERVLKLDSRDENKVKLVKQKLSLADELTSPAIETEAKPELGKTTCYTFGSISDSNESVKLAELLDKRGILYKRRQVDDSLVRLYLAPSKSQEQAEMTLKDLRQLGIKDMMLIREGELLNAISLGVFSKRTNVDERIEEIKAKGYQPLEVPYASGKKTFWIDVKIDQNSNDVDDLFTELPARYKAIPVDCNDVAMQ